MTFIVVALLAGCAQSQELTRSRASALIQNSKEFNEPVAVVLKSKDNMSVSAESSDEPEERARARAVELYFNDYPALEIFQHFGLLEVRLQVIKRPQAVSGPQFPVTRPDGTTVLTPPVRTGYAEAWQFKVEPRLTEKGLRAAIRVNGGSEYAMPLYRREVVQVTGVSHTGGGKAQAEFTWRVVPTEVGKAFDTGSAAFKNLPPKLRQEVTSPRGILQRTPFATTLERDYAGLKKGTAFFQRYDDGWRLTDVR
jgi:hypothetical protein